MKIAFFDFDGTITNRDSLLGFIRFAVGDIKFILGLVALSPMLILYKLKLIPNYKAKEMMLSYFFKGMDEISFQNRAREYSLNHLDTIVRKEALEKLMWHKSNGHKVVVVSASLENWLKPWCDRYAVELIATRLEIKDKIVTGRFLTKNCHGKQKVLRIKKEYELKDYNYIYAYGDSNGDRDMLCIADEKHYKPFRASLFNFNCEKTNLHYKKEV